MTFVIAHRGDHTRHCENTLEAFESAASRGADMVELDCKLTRDGHVAVLHDDTLARLWGVARPVRDLGWGEVSVIRRNGYRVPDLAEVLGTINLPVMVDVPGVEVLEASFAVARRARALDRCIFAGHTGALAHLRQMSRSARIALSWKRRGLPGPELLARTKPEWFNPAWHLVRPGAVDRAHAAGLAVSVWTVDSPWAVRWVLCAGVDAVVTNQTARLVSILAGRASGTAASSGTAALSGTAAPVATRQ